MKILGVEISTPEHVIGHYGHKRNIIWVLLCSIIAAIEGPVSSETTITANLGPTLLSLVTGCQYATTSTVCPSDLLNF